MSTVRSKFPQFCVTKEKSKHTMLAIAIYIAAGESNIEDKEYKST